MQLAAAAAAKFLKSLLERRRDRISGCIRTYMLAEAAAQQVLVCPKQQRGARLAPLLKLFIIQADHG